MNGVLNNSEMAVRLRIKTGYIACILGISLLVSAICQAAVAQLAPEASDEPIDITGDSLELIDDVAIWRGNVRAIQGEAILTSKELIATLDDAGGFKTIKAVGGMRYSNGKEAITGREGLYDALERTITVTDDVVVTQGKQVMTGGALVYWIDTGQLRFTAPSGRRIRGIFHPNEAETPQPQS
ncbi:MAG: LptA/OstA family protein [Pseudomonadota bacterium]